jgi:fructose-bisphosphate aldolase class II
MKTPALNTNRKFSENLKCAHELLLMAKNGQKGNHTQKRYALPAFNVTTYQGIDAAIEAFNTLGSSGVLAFSNSALKHFGHSDPIKGLEFVHEYVKLQAKYSNVPIATHLDHGDYLSEQGRKVVQTSVQALTSVMADNSTDHENKKATELARNIEATLEVVQMAHPLGVSVEGELGVLAGVEDEDTHSEFSSYTDPEDLKVFLEKTGVLMLAPTIGTMHGPNKGKPGDKVKLNISLAKSCLEIANKLNPEILFVAHGASTLYPEVIDYAVNSLDDASAIETWKNFVGTDWEQISELIESGFCKINTDTENRQTYVAALIGALKNDSTKVDIRHYEKITYKALVKSYIQKLIMAGNFGVWFEPKIDVKNYKFSLN